MVIISYNEAIDAEVMEAITSCSVTNYTKIPGVFGRGTTSEIHLGTDVWPGRNNILFVACTENQAKNILNCIKELRKTLGKEGVKAFVMPIEDIS